MKRVPPTRSERARKIARSGGYATLRQHGLEFYRTIGAMGGYAVAGRPRKRKPKPEAARRMTLAEIVTELDA
jgi:hypothetical protein